MPVAVQDCVFLFHPEPDFLIGAAIDSRLAGGSSVWSVWFTVSRRVTHCQFVRASQEWVFEDRDRSNGRVTVLHVISDPE